MQQRARQCSAHPLEFRERLGMVARCEEGRIVIQLDENTVIQETERK